MANNRLYVGNIPFDADEHDIRDFFDDYEVVTLRIITDRETGRPRGFAFVELASAAEVSAAISELDGAQMGGRTIRVSAAHDPAGHRGSGEGGGGGGGQARSRPLPQPTSDTRAGRRDRRHREEEDFNAACSAAWSQ